MRSSFEFICDVLPLEVLTEWDVSPSGKLVLEASSIGGIASCADWFEPLCRAGALTFNCLLHRTPTGLECLNPHFVQLATGS